MSTDESTGQRLTAAIARLEKLLRLQEQLPPQIDAAKAEVSGIMEELGFETRPKRAARKPRSAAGATGRARGGRPLAPETQAVLDFLRDRGPATLDTMAAELSMDRSILGKRLGALAQGANARVARDDEHRDLWRLVGVPHGVDQPEAQAA